MRGALEAGGRVTGVLADSLEKTAMRREHRNLLLEDRLVLISPYDPSAGFNVGHAMQRNKLIYALADAALVVSSEPEQGRHVGRRDRAAGEAPLGAGLRADDGRGVRRPRCAREEGSAALARAGRRRGAGGRARDAGPRPRALVEAAPALLRAVHGGRERGPGGGDRPIGAARTGRPARVPPATDRPGLSAADELFGTVRSLVTRLAREPRNATEIAHGLGVTTPQAQKWLGLLVEEGTLEQSKRPVRYVVCQTALFEGDDEIDSNAESRAAGAGT